MRLQVCLFAGTIQLSLLPRGPQLANKTKHGQSDDTVSPVGSRVRTCTGIVELFKHLCTTGAAEQVRQTQQLPDQCFDWGSFADLCLQARSPCIVCTDPWPTRTSRSGCKRELRRPETRIFCFYLEIWQTLLSLFQTPCLHCHGFMRNFQLNLPWQMLMDMQYRLP